MKKKGILIVLLVLALILAAGSMFTVAEDEYACTVRFSKIIDTTSEAGPHFKLPFGQREVLHRRYPALRHSAL